jgi:mono/diheme cytochrome c family protein
VISKAEDPDALLLGLLPGDATMRTWIILTAVMLGGFDFAKAQDVRDIPMGEIGDPQAGFEYAHEVCAACHAISQEKSPNPKAPRFKEVANTPGMTPTAIKVWLQNANHPTMPNIMIKGQELRNLTAYILSLKN